MAEDNPPVGMTLSGRSILADGTRTTKTDFFRVLGTSLDRYEDIVLTPEEAITFRNYMHRMSTGAAAQVPLLCAGPKCFVADRCPLQQIGKAPIGRQCHPPGEMILTTRHGYVPIEKLDPLLHGLVGYEKRRNAIRRGAPEDKIGFSFSVSSKEYDGPLVVFKIDDQKSYKATTDHICIVRFNEKALNKFCVYLMRRGNHWRVGKSKILSICDRKYYLPFVNRGTMEGADAMWILGTYDFNTDALLAEEGFSIKFQASKVSFADSLSKIGSKYDGLYKWATFEQLNKHHESLVRPEKHYRDLLEELNLSIDFPVWEKDNNNRDISEVKLFSRTPMFIRACNIISVGNFELYS